MKKIIILLLIFLTGCANLEETEMIFQTDRKELKRSFITQLLKIGYKEVEDNIYEKRYEDDFYYFNIPSQVLLNLHSGNDKELTLYYYRRDEGTSFSKQGVRCNYNFNTLEKSRFCEEKDIEEMKQLRRVFGIELTNMNLTYTHVFDHYDEQSDAWKETANEDIRPSWITFKQEFKNPSDFNHSKLAKALKPESYQLKAGVLKIGFDSKGKQTSISKAMTIHAYNLIDLNYAIEGKNQYYYFIEDLAIANDNAHRCTYKFSMQKSDCDSSMDQDLIDLKQTFIDEVKSLKIELKEIVEASKLYLN